MPIFRITVNQTKSNKEDAKATALINRVCSYVTPIHFLKIIICLLTLQVSLSSNAKSFHFKMEDPRDVFIVRSAAAGTKMVQVVAYGKSTDAAVNKAMLDAVAAMTFDGVNGLGEMNGVPAVLYDGRDAYKEYTKYFDKFFKQGDFLPFVKKVNSGYPSGSNNVKTTKGRRIRILLIVDWDGLSRHYKNEGFKTVTSEFDKY